MNNKVFKKAKRLGIKPIQIERNMKDLKRIRKLYEEKKNVVSKDINYPNMKLKKLFNFGDLDFLRKLEFCFMEIKLQNSDKSLIDFAALKGGLLYPHKKFL